MISAILIIVGLSVLILIHELGHFIAAKNAGLLVEEFGFGFPPRLYGKKIGETVYSLNWLPFGGFVKIFGERSVEAGRLPEEGGADKSRSFAHQSAWKRFVIMGAGISINFLFGWLLLAVVLMIGSPQSVLITDVAPNTPAEEVGLLPGDQLVEYATPAEFSEFVNARRGQEVNLEIRRAGEVRTVTVTPRELEGTTGSVGVFITEVGLAPQAFFPALWDGLKLSITTMGEILKAFGTLLAEMFGSASIPENIVGPIGIFGIANQVGQLGFVFLLQLIALISLKLAILNFIPFPALDGGRILFLIIEKIKGGPLNQKVELWANAASFVFLLLLMIVITARDIINLV